jgi:diguanylate cyclase (GGDEF)-like protein
VEGQASVPLAFLSEDDTVPSRVAAAYAGASLFLTKPLVPEAFVAALRRFTSLKRAEDPRVLVVDDDPSFTQHIALILAREGMKVTELADPLRTLEALHEVHPDLVLLDVVMPTLSGFDVCKMIRSAPEWEELPVLFLTVKLSAADRLACFEAGGDDYLSKPILTAELLARIRVRLDRVRLHRDRVNKDALTGLLARQAFAEAVEKRLAENRRIVKPLALCLLDLDHFKQINDTHGHLAGDRVLKGLGKLLDSRFRTEDVRGRWGGEEFVVAFNGEGAEAARDMLGRVLGELRQMGFENDRGDSFSASFSAGISLFPDDGYSLEDLIRAADRRMYRAKENGRSRIEI